jgi:glycosyltransferase involved in cell wall biosynthesis
MHKLAFVVTEDWYFLSHRFGLGSAARKEGYDVTVITRCRDKASILSRAGMKTVNFEMQRRGMNVMGVFLEFIKLRSIISRYRPDIMHLVALRPVVVGGIVSLISCRTKFVFALTGLGFLFTDGRGNSRASKLLKIILPIILSRGLVIVQNTEDREVLQECGVDVCRIRLIRGSGVDVRKFKPTDEPTNVPIVMLPARLLWDKGVGEFVEAARILQERGLAARFVLVGMPDKDNPTSISEETHRAWLEEGIVELWGFQERIEEVLPQATVVCLPSYREGLPKSLLEAMACGLPCIATDTSGCREAVSHEDNGLLVPVKDVSSLADAIQQLLNNKEQRLKMGRRGRERAIEEFAEEVVNAQTLFLYKELLTSKT